MAKKRLLLVDDEVELVEMIKFRLEASGYEVLTANDGQQALEIARREKPDLIILDVMLPKMDGYKVCGLLKKDSRYAHIPVMMFTAKAMDADLKLGQEVSADAYLTKPFEPKVLLEKIKELVKE
ncbi:MAG: response regulator [Candidatus Omnitrophota bacterium]|nr:response regulator [Candidatus Omnitrophota bacterium]